MTDTKRIGSLLEDAAQAAKRNPMTGTDTSAEAETLAQHLETLVNRGVGESAPKIVCALLAERDRYKAQAERASLQLEAVRNEMEHVIECLCEEAEQARDESLKERSYKLAESCEATLAQIDAEGKTVFDMVSREEWQEMDERESNPDAAEPAEPRQPTVKPLEWEIILDGKGRDIFSTVYYASSPYGGYCIGLQPPNFSGPRFSWTGPNNTGGRGIETEEKAKAAAQADYERRILSALAEGDSQ